MTLRLACFCSDSDVLEHHANPCMNSREATQHYQQQPLSGPDSFEPGPSCQAQHTASWRDLIGTQPAQPGVKLWAADASLAQGSRSAQELSPSLDKTTNLEAGGAHMMPETSHAAPFGGGPIHQAPTTCSSIPAQQQPAFAPNFGRLSFYDPVDSVGPDWLHSGQGDKVALALAQPVRPHRFHRTSWSAGSAEPSGTQLSAGAPPSLRSRSMNLAAKGAAEAQPLYPKRGLLNRVRDSFAEALQTLLSNRWQEQQARCEPRAPAFQAPLQPVLAAPHLSGSLYGDFSHHGSEVVLHSLPDIAEEREEGEDDVSEERHSRLSLTHAA